MTKIKSISLDIETYSSVDLRKSGVFKYCESPDFEILLLGYSVDGGAVNVVDLASGEPIPEKIKDAIQDERVLKWAFNAQFERICLSRLLGYHTGDYLDPKSWRCTMVWSATMGLPLSLEGVGAVLGLEKQKLTEGKDLIRYFCKPCSPTASNGERTRNGPAHAPDKWAAFKSYNLRDVEAEIAIQDKLAKFPVPDEVWADYHLDQGINNRGVALDMALVHQAIQMDGRSRAELTRTMRALTELDNPNSVMQMKQWLSGQGLETDTLGKKAVADLIKTASEPLGKVLQLRQSLAKSSIKKYTAMESAVCADGRARGMFQFFGANRTGRWAGRIIQLQNLPQNHLPDLEQARSLVRSANYEALEMLYEDVPDTLSQLIRTAFIPKPGCKFIVADFSAIEARVIAWLAGETWRQEVFAKGEDIYCRSASQMFGVPVVKHGSNGHLRQKGKISELACIAEGQLVLTDRGEVPIEQVQLTDKVWDGISWVRHEGVVYRGTRKVMEYEGLTATPDHLVWVEGQKEPIPFAQAAASGSHLVQAGDGRNPIRMVEDNLCRKTLDQKMETLLCADGMHWMPIHTMARIIKSTEGQVEEMSKLLTASRNSPLAESELEPSEKSLRKSERSPVSQLRSTRNSIRFFQRNASWTVSDPSVRGTFARDAARSAQQQRELRSRKYSFCIKSGKAVKSPNNNSLRVRTGILALQQGSDKKKTFTGIHPRRDHRASGTCSCRKTQELAHHRCTARLYDIRNTGQHHRFTVSEVLVHNCGYGGSVGALKAMGALEMGLEEDELQGLVTAWRMSNPNIVRLWWDVDRAAIKAVKERTMTETHGVRFTYQSGMLFITLPSGRHLTYVKPLMGENAWGSECITYEGVGATKKWERIESYGPKFVENIVQATSRDLLCYAMQAQRGYSIVMHVHDEIVIEADPATTVESICEQMGQAPPWAKGLLLRAEGYETHFYKKD